VTNGDFRAYYTRDNKVYTAKNDWTKKTGKHLVKWGRRRSTTTWRWTPIRYAERGQRAGHLRARQTAFHYRNPEGSAALQDRWEHEGW
jgi:hypothetical protein